MQTSGTVCRVRSRATAANVPAAWLRHMIERVTPRLYIFDADGTLRWTRVPGQFCPYRAGEWELMPNVSRVLRGIPWCASTRLAIASKQDPVAWGCLSRADARAMLRDTLTAAVGRLPRGTLIELCSRPPPQQAHEHARPRFALHAELRWRARAQLDERAARQPAAGRRQRVAQHRARVGAAEAAPSDGVLLRRNRETCRCTPVYAAQHAAHVRHQFPFAGTVGAELARHPRPPQSAIGIEDVEPRCHTFNHVTQPSCGHIRCGSARAHATDGPARLHPPPRPCRARTGPRGTPRRRADETSLPHPCGLRRPRRDTPALPSLTPDHPAPIRPQCRRRPRHQTARPHKCRPESNPRYRSCTRPRPPCSTTRAEPHVRPRKRDAMSGAIAREPRALKDIAPLHRLRDPVRARRWSTRCRTSAVARLHAPLPQAASRR